jgi:hypothetical protein
LQRFLLAVPQGWFYLKIRLFTVRSAKHMIISFAGCQILEGKTCCAGNIGSRRAATQTIIEVSFHSLLHDVEAFRWQSRETLIAGQSFP